MDTFYTAHKLYTINGTAVQRTDSSVAYHNAYGTAAINTNSTNKYQWTLRFEDIESDLFVGISSTRDTSKDYASIAYAYQTAHSWAWHLGSHQSCGSVPATTKNNSGYIKSGTITMSVDCANKTIRFGVNGKDFGIAYNNVSAGTYYLTVSLYSGGLVTITDFSCNGGTPHVQSPMVEQKENEQLTLSLKKQIADITAAHNGLKRENAKLNDRINGLQRENAKLKQENETWSAFSEKVNVLEAENAKLNERINGLLDDHKEMEMNISDLERENAKLKASINLDYSKWKEWDTEKVFHFIMSTVGDGSLDQYENDIKNEIFESEYTGKDLQDIELDHLKSMGIKRIKTRNIVFKAVKKLIQNKLAPNIEGNNDAPTAYL